MRRIRSLVRHGAVLLEKTGYRDLSVVAYNTNARQQALALTTREFWKTRKVGSHDANDGRTWEQGRDGGNGNGRRFVPSFLTLGLTAMGVSLAMFWSRRNVSETENADGKTEPEEEYYVDDEDDYDASESAKPRAGKDATSINDGSQFYIPPSSDSSLKLYSGNANWHLANEISMHLGVQLGRAMVKRFPDGEVQIKLLDNVRGKDVFVIQPLGPPVNENLMELILMITTLRRASARKITAVIPYFGYSRSTHKENARTPIAAADVAKMLQVAGADRIVAVDLHHAQIQGFFGPNTPVDNLDVSSIAIPYFETKFLNNPVIVSPDANGAARAKSFRDKLIRHNMNATLAVIVDHNAKKRGWESEEILHEEDIGKWDTKEIDAMELVGDVRGRDCVIFDDMVDSGGRISRAASKLKREGASRVFAFATHGLFLGNAYERIERSDLIEVVCVNTLPLQQTTVGGIHAFNYCSKVHQLSVGALLAEAIRRIHQKQSVSALFSF